MSEINQGGFVYSRESHKNIYGHKVAGQRGITRRDYLAALAMQGMLSNTSKDTQDAKAEFLAIATLSYRMADFMIAESQKGA